MGALQSFSPSTYFPCHVSSLRIQKAARPRLRKSCNRWLAKLVRSSALQVLQPLINRFFRSIKIILAWLRPVSGQLPQLSNLRNAVAALMSRSNRRVTHFLLGSAPCLHTSTGLGTSHEHKCEPHGDFEANEKGARKKKTKC